MLSLHEAGYLQSIDGSQSSNPIFLLSDVKALAARLTHGEDQSGNQDFDELGFFDELEMEASAPADLSILVSLLDEQSGDMAARAYTSLCKVYEPATSWTIEQRARFIEQTRTRFEAIFAIVVAGDAIDLAGELGEVGAAAARSGSSLPELLATLRISRDLIVESAIELLEMSHQQWSDAFLVLVARILPAIDNLTDAISKGYWSGLMVRNKEALSSHQQATGFSADGMYEIDLDGQIRTANPALAVLVGWPLAALSGALLGDVFVPVEGANTIERLMADSSPQLVMLKVTRPDGIERQLAIGTSVRRDAQGEAIAFHGVVRDVTWVSKGQDLATEDIELLAAPSAPLSFDLAEVLRAALEPSSKELATGLQDHLMATGDVRAAKRLVVGLLKVLEEQALKVASVEAENDEWWVNVRFLVSDTSDPHQRLEPAFRLCTMFAQAQGGNLRYEEPRNSLPDGQASLVMTLPNPALVGKRSNTYKS